jgi:hypothetical protein
MNYYLYKLFYIILLYIKNNNYFIKIKNLNLKIIKINIMARRG